MSLDFLSVCLTCISQERHIHTSLNFRCLLAFGRGSFLLYQRCNTLYDCVFLSDIMFSYSRPFSGMTLPQHPRSSVYGLTPLLHGISYMWY